jgi:hypothetical protein
MSSTDVLRRGGLGPGKGSDRVRLVSAKIERRGPGDALGPQRIALFTSAAIFLSSAAVS